jgi:hypothetical protein
MTTLLRRALFALAGRLPTRIIWAEQSEHDPSRSPLFERSHLFTVRLPLIGDVTCYLHHYLRSDPDAGLHDHPWPWAIAVPLVGGYREERLIGMHMGHVGSVTRRRRPLLPYRLTGYDFHRVLVENDTTSWSLFFTGQDDFKPWGFLRPVPAEMYRQTPGAAYHIVSSKDGNHTPWHRTAPLGRFHDRAAP